MSRTNIDIDDTLIHEAMRRSRLKNKREAVNYALENLLGRPATSETLRSIRGVGWDGELEELRRSRVRTEPDSHDRKNV